MWCRHQLGELAHERAAIDARGAVVLAISPDSAQASRALAKRYSIPFSLIQDKKLALARAFVGIDDEEYPVPGVVIVGEGRRILYRQIGRAAGDRLYTRQLLRILDAERSTGARVPVRGGRLPLSRKQLQVGATVAATNRRSQESKWGVAGGLQLGVYVPLARRLVVGMSMGIASGDVVPANVSAAVRLRQPFFGEIAELYVEPRVGAAIDVTRGDGDGHRRLCGMGGSEVGVQLAQWPSFGFFIESAVHYLRCPSSGAASSAHRELRYQLAGGIVRLF